MGSVTTVAKCATGILAAGTIIISVLLLDTNDPIWNWVFIRRVLTFPSTTPVTSVDWYDVQATVQGGTRKALQKGSVSSPVLNKALDEAASYAEAKKSSALIVLHDGQLLTERYWRGHGENSRTNSFSMAKSILALMVGIAIDEKLIGSENENAVTYLREWQRDDRAAITLRHLLQMTSGLAREGQLVDNVLSGRNALFLGTNLTNLVTSWPIRKPPGREFDYNDFTTQALSVILEKAVGKSLPQYLSEKMWQLIGADEATMWLDRSGGTARAFCCIFATARSWALVGQLLLDEGRADGRQIVSRDWIKRMTTPSELEPDYGFQIWLGSENGTRKDDRSTSFLAKDIVYLNGKFKQRVYTIPSRQLVIVRVGENAKGWDDAFLPNTIVAGIDQARKRGVSDRSQLASPY